MIRTGVISDTLLESLAKGQEVSVPAIVLRARPYRDSDLLAQLLTPTLGKISVIGRHARGSKKRFPSSLDIFDRGTARIGKDRSGALSVREFTPSHSLVKLRHDLDKLTLASLLCECFDVLTQENAEPAGSALFELLDLSLNAIEEAEELRPCLRATCVALSSLLRIEGLADINSNIPGSKMLNTILNKIEHFSERHLLTRTSVLAIINRLTQQSTSSS